MQLLTRLNQVFKEAGLAIFLKPYQIVVTSSNSGMIEFIPDTTSIDKLKKKLPKKQGRVWSLREFFERNFLECFEEAQKNFADSLAGYSLFCYIFSVKDRHNGNILLDA